MFVWTILIKYCKIAIFWSSLDSVLRRQPEANINVYNNIDIDVYLDVDYDVDVEVDDDSKLYYPVQVTMVPSKRP